MICQIRAAARTSVGLLSPAIPILLSAAVRSGALGVALLALIPDSSLMAQVGHLPDRSPYEDYATGQNFTLGVGSLSVGRDPANVAPKSSTIFTLRYDVSIGGPASFYVRYALAPSERRLLVPTNLRTARDIGTTSVKTHIADLGLDLSLTGRKTWRHLSPSLLGGVGVASNFADVDTGGYRFGTKFTFTYGAALRYVTRSGFAIRAEAVNYTWQYRYPDRYFVQATDSTAILSDTRQRSAYRGNWALVAGVTLPLFR